MRYFTIVNIFQVIYTQIGKNVSDICRRLAMLRVKQFGPRGKARFARALGIGPSTYHHYEVDRAPPAEVLVNAAKTTGANLERLLTGEGAMDSSESSAAVERSADPLVKQMKEILAKNPELHRSVAGFLDLLREVADTLPDAGETETAEGDPLDDLIPVIGGTAAGPAHFWRDLDDATGEIETEARLEAVVSGHARRAVRHAELVTALEDSDPLDRVALVQFSQTDAHGFVEFLSCRVAKAKYS